ncbi:hypothetical protein OG21DRAFT_1489340 [Imleria badia]|nr:hypothetical protein OG21DRAFT_1489340 [Imleria badia]
MDPLIENDTHAVHWVLDEAQTTGFVCAFFSDKRIFNKEAFSDTPQLPNTVSSVSSILHSLPPSIYANGHFAISTETRVMEVNMAKFFNDILQHTIGQREDIHPLYKQREWTGDGVNRGLAGCDALRKPDLILCHRPMSERKIDMWIDILSIGEMKSSNQKDKLKESFIELAGKVTFLHQAQDGQYATPCIQLLGKDVVFTIFDRGGSISTQPISIHNSPEHFLCILLSITFAPRITLGFGVTVHKVKNKTRDIEVTLVDGEKTVININELIFISGSLHGSRTAVWSSHLMWSGVEHDIVVKDSFIDPL